MYEKIFDDIDDLVLKSVTAIQNNDFALLGQMMNFVKVCWMHSKSQVLNSNGWLIWLEKPVPWAQNWPEEEEEVR